MKNPRGQALIPLLIVLVIAISLATLAIELSINNMIIDRSFMNGLTGYYSAESVLEDSFLRWLRNPNYSGDTMMVNGLDCTSQVTGSSPWLVQVSCGDGRFVRKISAEVNWVDGEMTVSNVMELI